jgi:3-oxoacyl-[acyl-carrier protein] reductase
MTKALLETGHRVSVVAHSDVDALRSIDRETAMRFGKDRLLGVRADISRVEECEHAVTRTQRAFGRIDILVNNAGRYFPSFDAEGNVVAVKFWKSSAEEWREAIEINLNGAYYMTRLVVPQMIERGFGRIINVSTSWRSLVRNGHGSYGPSKAALEASTAAWAKDLAGTGVTCNVLLPGGASDTRMSVGMARSKEHPLLSPEIMAAPIVWLVSERSAAWTGRRFVAKDWDIALPPDEAAMKAASPAAIEPIII